MTTKLSHQFVEFIPAELQDGVLYISLEFGTVIHRCCCGCGRKVVTPLAPAAWRMGYDGETITLHPSIGNWQFPCRSHYWVRNGRAVWIRDDGRTPPRAPKPEVGPGIVVQPREAARPRQGPSFWRWLPQRWRPRR